ncbi:unnamed protein product [Rhizophagus irregularis]|nr:unnamed protein product [Rhizophagus irregularis]
MNLSYASAIVNVVFTGLMFGIFLAALDQTIVATTLHAIAVEFSSLDQIAWISIRFSSFCPSIFFTNRISAKATVFSRIYFCLMSLFIIINHNKLSG